ncbi:hypothetical protein A2572_04995 [Candidatus Collierbacteria bacterium RIFOXYD1_FULL_40_9]|uniref:Uncharacterized protein n=1 Tax=Candidatus Collierbacteria bacterium RIFOXYD1_FULL_40_9 TaxID=1817731 RepID=A0A1F5FU01_9BACT|nr:MAG: hypothetical protein A2572_04995 [Candidatus Collierbacteria bacterium RIFOXYD1_FULL_40_9]
MHFSLKFSNLDPNLETSWSDLRRLSDLVSKLYPNQKIEVKIEFAYAQNFVVDPYAEIIAPAGPVKIELYPQTNCKRDDLNPQSTKIVSSIVDLIIKFLAASVPANTNLFSQPYTPSTEISISHGFGVYKFTDAKPDEYP